MWVCPKCGREFARTNQGHYCGEPPKTVSEYIDSLPGEARPDLEKIASVIRESVPNVNEKILWSMPTYENSGKTVSFSACKNYVSLYIGAKAVEKFAPELGDFKTKKNTVYLPYGNILPTGLIETIIKWCLL